MTPELMDSWYEEHLTDLLNTPGNGGLAIRYTNADPSVDLFRDPDFPGRMAAPESTSQKVSEFGWGVLALVKLSDVNWCTSNDFNNMPRTSKLLPLEADGSVGSAFSCWHAGLRTYETVERVGGVEAGAQWVVTLQLATPDPKEVESAVEQYKHRDSYRGHLVYRLVEGLLPYPEPACPGHLPAGLLVLEFESETAPEVATGGAIKVTRTDVWKRKLARGTTSLLL